MLPVQGWGFNPWSRNKDPTCLVALPKNLKKRKSVVMVWPFSANTCATHMMKKVEMNKDAWSQRWSAREGPTGNQEYPNYVSLLPSAPVGQGVKVGHSAGDHVCGVSLSQAMTWCTHHPRLLPFFISTLPPAATKPGPANKAHRNLQVSLFHVLWLFGQREGQGWKRVGQSNAETGRNLATSVRTEAKGASSRIFVVCSLRIF